MAKGNWYAGRAWQPPSGEQPTGSSAVITRPAAAELCTSANSATAAYVMLAPTNTSGWAQIGFVTQNNTSTWWDLNDFFMQWTRGPGYSGGSLYWGAPSNGGSWEFQATRQTGDGLIHLLKDGADNWHTDFDPLTAWNSGRSSEFYSEIIHKGDDFYGTNGNRTDFAQVQSKTVSGWANKVWNKNGSGLCYGHTNEITNNSHFAVWTSPLDHNC